MKVKYLLYMLIVVAFMSCNKSANEVLTKPRGQAPMATQGAGASSGEVESVMDQSKKMKMEDCLQEYSDLGELNATQGVVVTVMDMLMISYGQSSRVNPCNMPDSYIEGDAVIFSGTIKESPKGVRLAGTPFKLSSIRKK